MCYEDSIRFKYPFEDQRHFVKQAHLYSMSSIVKYIQ